jgi:hypothetical protein
MDDLIRGRRRAMGTVQQITPQRTGRDSLPARRHFKHFAVVGIDDQPITVGQTLRHSRMREKNPDGPGSFLSSLARPSSSLTTGGWQPNPLSCTFHVALMLLSLISAVGGFDDGDEVRRTLASSSLARPLSLDDATPANTGRR